MRGLRLLLWLPLFLALTACPPGGKDADDTGPSDPDVDDDGDGFTENDGDCDDDDSDIYPWDRDEDGIDEGCGWLVSAGGNHNCGVKTDGSIVCWGKNDDGQCDPPDGSFQPVSAGGEHTCGVKTDGSVACWGLNDDGQCDVPKP